MNKCECGNSLFPGQFRCEKCGKIQNWEEPEKKETKKKESKQIDRRTEGRSLFRSPHGWITAVESYTK